MPLIVDCACTWFWIGRKQAQRSGRRGPILGPTLTCWLGECTSVGLLSNEIWPVLPLPPSLPATLSGCQATRHWSEILPVNVALHSKAHCGLVQFWVCCSGTAASVGSSYPGKGTKYRLDLISGIIVPISGSLQLASEKQVCGSFWVHFHILTGIPLCNMWQRAKFPVRGLILYPLSASC